MINKIYRFFRNFIKQLGIKFQLNSLFSNYNIENKRDKHAVIFSAIGNMYITYYEIMFYHILRFMGYNVKYYIYNYDNPINELTTQSIVESGKAKFFIKKNVSRSIKVLKSANVKFEFIDYYPNIFDLINFKKPDTLNEIFEFKYENINFGHITKRTLYRYYKSKNFKENDYNTALKYLIVALSNYHFIHKINFKNNKIDLLFMSHGIYTSWEPIKMLCEKYSINYVCYDRAKTTNHIILNKNQEAPNWDFSSSWRKYINKKLNKNEDQLVSKYFLERENQKGDVFSYNFSGREEGSSLKRRFNIPKDKLIITIFSNVIWDAANVSRDITFEDTLDCIIKTIEKFKKNNKVHIVVRTHPAEKVLGTNEGYYDLINKHLDNKKEFNNYTIIKPNDNVNSYSVIDISDIGIVNTSTVGLEFAMSGKPILLISETHYRNKGFTYDISSQKQYFDILDCLINEINLKPNQVEISRKYFYMMMFLYQKNTPLKYENNIFCGYNFNNFLDLINDDFVKEFIYMIDNIDSIDDFVNW